MSLAPPPDIPQAPTAWAVPPCEQTSASATFRPQSWPVRGWHAVRTGLEWTFGLASLLACLAAMAAVPLLNFVALGYLLEASGRVAKSGRVRDGLIDMFRFARIGSIAAGTWLCLLVPRLVASFASDAWLIDPAGERAGAWRVAQVLVTCFVIAHIILAWYSGGRLRHFFWPLLAPFQLAGWLLIKGPLGKGARRMVFGIWPALASDLFRERPLSDWFPPAIVLAGLRSGRMFADSRDAVWNFTVALGLPRYFWLGIRGFAGGLVWLLVPSVLLMAGTSGGGPPTVLLGALGAVLMVAAILPLPFLQAHFAAENRFLALFEWRAVLSQFGRAPLAFLIALFLTLLFALPLYVFKIEPILPPELQWTATIFFVALIYPARLAAGWAAGRARKRERPRLALLRWVGLAAAIPLAGFYVFVVFFSQYTSFLGPASILEQHAFLLPAPFFSR